MASIEFFGPDDPETGFLSNFYPIVVRYTPNPQQEAVAFATSEHMFHWWKCVYPNDAHRIQQCADPGKAKRLGRKATLRDDWELIKIPVMHLCVRSKFVQNPRIAELLLETYPDHLIEANPRDDFWGEGDGSGLNMLGHILMMVRHEIRVGA